MKKKIISLILFSLILVGCNNTELTCQRGELVDGVCKVVDVVDATINCPTGYEFNKEKGKCANTMKIAAKTVNTCSKGYVIGKEKWCVSEKKYNMVETTSCVSNRIKEGDTLSSTYISKANMCFEKICVEKSEDGQTCLKYDEKQIKYTVTKACPSGTKKWDGSCRKISWMYIDTSCAVGELDGDKCIIENLTDASITCSEGYKLTEDYKCEKIIYEEPK